MRVSAGSLVVRALVAAGFLCLILHVALYDPHDPRYTTRPFGEPLEASLLAAGCGLDVLVAWAYFRTRRPASPPPRSLTAANTIGELLVAAVLSYVAVAGMWLLLALIQGPEPSEWLAGWLNLRGWTAPPLVAICFLGPLGAGLGTAVRIISLLVEATQRGPQPSTPAVANATTYSLAAALGGLMGLVLWPGVVGAFWLWSAETKGREYALGLSEPVILLFLLPAFGAPVGGLIAVMFVAARSASSAARPRRPTSEPQEAIPP